MMMSKSQGPLHPVQPQVAATSREVLRWCSTLDLSHPLRNVRRDVANGFLVAQLLARYYPVRASHRQSHASCLLVSTKTTRWGLTVANRSHSAQGGEVLRQA